MGDSARVEPLLVEAKTIHEKALGKEHPLYATSLNNLAGLYYAMGDYARAEPLYRQAIDATLNHLEKTAYVQSEQQQMLMNQSVRQRLDNYLQCCLDGDLDPKEAIARLVAWKGSILMRQRGLRLAASDPSISDQFRQLQSVASQISAATRAVPAAEKLAVWRKRLDLLTEQKQALESELMRRSAAFRGAVKNISFDEVRASVPEEAVLIDYLEYNGSEGRALLASVIRRGGEPVMLDLGSAEKAGEAIDTWRESFGMLPKAKQAGQELRRQLWEPLLEHIAGAELILVSTDGVLGRFPIAALPGSKPDSYLLEDHRLALIPVPQLLPALVSEQPAGRLDREMLLMGEVDYDARLEADGDSDETTDQPKRRRPPSQRTVSDRSIRGGVHFDALPETGNEVRFIAELYENLFQLDEDDVVDLRKSKASETAFREFAPQCMYVHLATHGFFAAGETKSALSAESIAQAGKADRGMFGERREAIRGHNPGQLSGIAFAGANHPPNVDDLSGSPADDGIMTADEIAFLPLGGVRLVVLSACDTGLGEVAGGEGLLGIQRGFQVAGTQTTIASLWKVNDAATRRLMQEFYTNYLGKEMSVLDALRETQLWALNHPGDVPRGVTRADVDTTPKRLPPKYWAPFVLSGDWR